MDLGQGDRSSSNSPVPEDYLLGQLKEKKELTAPYDHDWYGPW